MPTRLTVLYDASCAMCRRARSWLRRQDQLVPLEFVAAASTEARRRFPGLDAKETMKLLHVVDEHGRVYRGEKAWVMCLWALDEYRGWSLRVAEPPFIDRAERFVRWVSSRRYLFGGPGGRRRAQA